MRHSILAGGLALLVGSVLASGARAEAHFVPAEFPTIQAAVDACADGDVILVSPGLWTGPVETDGLSIEIRGVEGAEVTILDAQGASVALKGPSFPDQLHVIGLTITGGGDGVVAQGDGKVALSNCVVRDNSGIGARGRIEAYNVTFSGNGSHGLEGFEAVRFCTFTGNGGWGALDLNGVLASPLLEDCNFLDNGLGGVRLSAGAPAGVDVVITVLHCLFVGDNVQVAAVTSAGGKATSILRNVTLIDGTLKLMQGSLDVTSSILLTPTPVTDFSPTGDATITWSDVGGAWLSGTGNIDVDPQFADPDGGDYSLVPGSPCINTGNPAFEDFDFSPSDMGAVTYEPWTYLPGGVASLGGEAQMGGVGPLIGGEGVGFSLFPDVGVGVWLVVSTTELGVPFKGGVLWPAVDAVFGPLVPHFPSFLYIAYGVWPAGLPAGFSFVAQAWWPDAGAPQSWAASNGVRGVQP